MPAFIRVLFILLYMRYSEAIERVLYYKDFNNKKIISKKTGVVSSVDYITVLDQDSETITHATWLNAFDKDSMAHLIDKNCKVVFILDYHPALGQYGTTYL